MVARDTPRSTFLANSFHGALTLLRKWFHVMLVGKSCCDQRCTDHLQTLLCSVRPHPQPTLEEHQLQQQQADELQQKQQQQSDQKQPKRQRRRWPFRWRRRRRGTGGCGGAEHEQLVVPFAPPCELCVDGRSCQQLVATGRAVLGTPALNLGKVRNRGWASRRQLSPPPTHPHTHTPSHTHTHTHANPKTQCSPV